jgi:hypothetical protein
MKKPTPPFSGQSNVVAPKPQAQAQDLPSPKGIDPFSMPIEPPASFYEAIGQASDNIYIDDAIIEARPSGAAVGAKPDSFKKLCTGCANYWSLETLAPVKNTKEDGTPFTRIEEYCIFSDKLFTLSEREVFTCTRFTARKS